MSLSGARPHSMLASRNTSDCSLSAHRVKSSFSSLVDYSRIAHRWRNHACRTLLREVTKSSWAADLVLRIIERDTHGQPPLAAEFGDASFAFWFRRSFRQHPLADGQQLLLR